MAMATGIIPQRGPRSYAPSRRRAPTLVAAGAGSVETHRATSLVHRLSLVMVWLTIATSGIVLSEPAPVDVLSMGLVLLLPTVGLAAITPSLLVFLALWLVCAAGGFIAAGLAPDVGEAAKFTAVSLYLYLAAFVFAAFVARSPARHLGLVLNAWTFAALVAAATGIAGYFNLLPGAGELWTKFGRASGTFKDPNVFGPFLVPAILFMLHLIVSRPITRVLVPLLAAGVLMLAVLLSFSRGAWINLALATLVFGYLAFVTTASVQQRERIVSLLTLGLVVLAGVLVFAMQNERVADLMAERATLTQSYDVGPQGRFGGQARAVDIIVENPLGIGALVFGDVHHHEEPHNVYLAVLLNNGWIGGAVFWLMTGLTLILGLRHLARDTPTRPLFLVLYAAFLANALEGLIIDLDHWRHYYLLMGLMWGCMTAQWHRLPGGDHPGHRAA